MRQLIAVTLLFCSFFWIPFRAETEKNMPEFDKDTCIIEKMIFKIIKSEGPQKYSATIKNGHIKVIIGNQNGNFKVIRYVFSIDPNERIASVVRNYGSLVSYPVILDLKVSSVGDRFYFENIIIVNPQKQILNNAVKPLIIERLK